MSLVLESARPAPFPLPVGRTALIIVDMQRDFVQTDGYGAVQCPSPEIFAQVANLIGPLGNVLAAARKLGMTVIHTREGHVPDLSDCPPTKRHRQVHSNDRHVLTIGDTGPMGRLLIRGEYGHDVVDALTPYKDEVILDKPGKGCFYNTDLHQLLVARGITHILFTGVTAECCVASTFREANDHGFECCVLSDCTQGFNPTIVSATLDMFCAYDGLLGYSSTSKAVVAAAADAAPLCLAPKLPTLPASRLTLPGLRASFKAGELTPTALVKQLAGAGLFEGARPIATLLEAAAALEKTYGSALHDLPPLYGVPFAVSAEIAESAEIVSQLVAFGAILVGSVAAAPLALVGGESSPAAALVAGGSVAFAVVADTDGNAVVPATADDVTVYSVTKGFLSTNGVAAVCPSIGSLVLIANSVLEARSVWADLIKSENVENKRRAVKGAYNDLDGRDPRELHMRDIPIVSVDYRGFGETGFTFLGLPETAVEALPATAAASYRAGLKSVVAAGGREISAAAPASSAEWYANYIGAAELANSEAGILVAEKAAYLSTLVDTVPAGYATEIVAKSAGSAVTAFKKLAQLATLSANVARVFDSGANSPEVLVLPVTAGGEGHEALTAFTAPVNVLGLCALAVNGVLLVGPKGVDCRMLEIGMVVQA
ncbi:Isochorismatase-like protein [Dipodascopsis tothii]|uniref:Isochorismatase-like protein n=1 Tax=Dipodascopsis tothii TaxID=44089 RepID=UPI0034CEC6D3